MIHLNAARALILATAVIGLGAAAGPALGAGYTLNITPPSALVVGQPAIFQASGSNPPDDFFTSWLDVAAIPTSVLPSCPADYLQANQIARSAYAQGGDVPVTAQRENVDAAGNWSMPFAFTPSKPGRFLICGYTNDGATWTHTMAALAVDIQGGSAGVAKPANLRKPRVVRAGRKLVCSRGRWSNSPTRYSYRWVVNGKRKKGASGRKLGITRQLGGRSVRCSVTARNAGGATTAVSRALAVR